MTKVSRTWMAVVAAALLAGTLVGVVWARPNDRPGAAESTRKVTLSAAEFVSARDGQDWQATGTSLECSSGFCHFYAPVVFPCLSSVTVERMKLHVEDGNGSTWVAAVLSRSAPSKPADVFLGRAESPAGTAAFQTYDSGAINKVVWPSQRAQVWLHIGGPFIDVYGVTVEYHRNM